MKLLITGAFGLVGSNICSILEREYSDIEITKVKFDDIPWGSESKFDYAIHCSGYGQPLKFSEDKLKTIYINTEFTKKLFSVLKPGGKFLFVSTSEVYSGAPSPHKETDIGTTTPQHPRACYIEGKRCGEAICMVYKEQGYDVKIARLALAYGPGTKKGDTRAINQLIEKAITTGQVSVRDSGNAERNYLYVEDCAKMILNILFKGKETVYNVGGNSKTTIANLAALIAKQTEAALIYGTDTDASAPQSVDLDTTKIMAEFPMELTYLTDGLKKTIEYQKKLYA